VQEERRRARPASKPAGGSDKSDATTLTPMIEPFETVPLSAAATAFVPWPQRAIVMVGLMGAGKTAIGKRLATRIELPFFDTDKEIETAAGCTIADIFGKYGEAAFRDCERRVIARLLAGPRCVLATGGGAFMDAQTRAAIKHSGLSVWLKADLDTLVRRTAKRTHRPLLNSGDPREILARLMAVREPVYAEADLHVLSNEASPDETTQRVEDAIERQCGTACPSC
jgi:shikimate kinase